MKSLLVAALALVTLVQAGPASADPPDPVEEVAPGDYVGGAFFAAAFSAPPTVLSILFLLPQISSYDSDNEVGVDPPTVLVPVALCAGFSALGAWAWGELEDLDGGYGFSLLGALGGSTIGGVVFAATESPTHGIWTTLTFGVVGATLGYMLSASGGSEPEAPSERSALLMPTVLSEGRDAIPGLSLTLGW